MNLVDSQLYRPLKSGKEFEGLIPAYQGLDHSFDKKKDNSTTFDTLVFMDNWSTKHASQMSKVASKLKGGSLEQTVKNIYAFLYSHFQYKLDGALQNLYSPSAAWHFRESGFDCKTYSILASTILQNLSIPHSFRMVQQAGVMPNEWSHVYVIVPNGNSYYIIDATTHDNREVTYTKKHDHIMKHRGLASPYIAAQLGCACSGTAIKSKGLGSPSTMAATVKNLHVFLNEIEAKGVPKEVTNRMLYLIKWNIDNGIDPNMGEILEKAYNPTQGLGYITPVNGGLVATGSTYGSMPTASSIPSSYGSPTQNTSFGSTLLSGGTSALSNISVGGVPVMGVANDLMSGNFVGAGLTILKNIIPIEKTFGAVFANGFDLSCWNSATNEQKEKVNIETDMPHIIEWSGIYKAANSETLDKFMFATQGYIDHAAGGQNSKSACTRKGEALRQKAAEQLRADVLLQFSQQGFTLIPAGKKRGLSKWIYFPPSKAHEPVQNGQWERANTNTVFDSYTVVSPQAVAPTAKMDQYGNQVTTTTNPDGSTTTTTVDANGNTTTNTVAKSSSSLSTLVTIGSAIALGAKLLF